MKSIYVDLFKAVVQRDLDVYVDYVTRHLY